MEFYQVIQERRSVRKYQEEDVPREVLERLLDAARLAPSWANHQCWRFVVVKDPQKKEELAGALPEKNPARKSITQAPVVIVLCADPSASGKQDGKEYYLLDAGLAMEHLVLAARAEELGTCWIAWNDEKIVKETCNIPDEFRVVALSPLGYPAKEPSPRPRKELSEIVFLEEWGNLFK